MSVGRYGIHPTFYYLTWFRWLKYLLIYTYSHENLGLFLKTCHYCNSILWAKTINMKDISNNISPFSRINITRIIFPLFENKHNKKSHRIYILSIPFSPPDSAHIPRQTRMFKRNLQPVSPLLFRGSTSHLSNSIHPGRKNTPSKFILLVGKIS